MQEEYKEIFALQNIEKDLAVYFLGRTKKRATLEEVIEDARSYAYRETITKPDLSVKNEGLFGLCLALNLISNRKGEALELPPCAPMQDEAVVSSLLDGIAGKSRVGLKTAIAEVVAGSSRVPMIVNSGLAAADPVYNATCYCRVFWHFDKGIFKIIILHYYMDFHEN